MNERGIEENQRALQRLLVRLRTPVANAAESTMSVRCFHAPKPGSGCSADLPDLSLTDGRGLAPATGATSFAPRRFPTGDFAFLMVFDLYLLPRVELTSTGSPLRRSTSPWSTTMPSL